MERCDATQLSQRNGRVTVAKSLKEQNNIKIWMFIAVNILVFYSVLVSGKIELTGLKEALINAATLVPAAIAGALATAINALPSSQMKARLVYMRWTNPLPGHRVFTRYAPQDPRIDMDRLQQIVGTIPTDEAEQNRVWYRLYKPVADQPLISAVHRDFLLMRDFTALSAILILVMAPLAAYLIADKRVAASFGLLLVVELLFFGRAAANCGIRMATNVLATVAATSPKAPAKRKAAARKPAKPADGAA